MDSFTNRYLDELIGKLALPSDYAAAQLLGLSHQAIYKMRAGGAMSTATAAKLAELLELDPLQVIADCELERATSEAERELWKRIARKVACVAVAALGLSGSPSPTQAAPGAPQGPQGDQAARLCIMSNRRRRRRPWLTPLAGLFAPA